MDKKEALEKLRKETGNKSKSMVVQIKLFIKGLPDDTKHEEVLKDILEYLRSAYHNINSLDQSLTQIRKVYKTRFPDHDKVLINKGLMLTPDQRKSKVDKQASVLKKDLKKKVLVNPVEVIRIIRGLNAMGRSLQERIILLQLVTGRRLVEILKITGLPKRSRKKGMIVIDKISKSDKTNFPVPLLVIEYEDMVKHWKVVRSGLEKDSELSNEEITAKYNRRINNKANLLFKDIIGQRATSHDMRKIYAAVAYETLAPKDMDQQLYIGDILGHQSEDSSRYYQTVSATKEPEKKVNVQKGMGIIESGFRTDPKILKVFYIVRQLEELGIPATARNLKKHGRIGSSTVQKFFKYIKELGDNPPAGLLPIAHVRAKPEKITNPFDQEKEKGISLAV